MSEFELRFSDREITPWGGMALMKRMLDRLGVSDSLGRCGLPQPGSNRGYCPRQLVLQFMLSVWCGANRFEHAEVTRHDGVLQRLFGWRRMANFKAIQRLFKRFDQGTNQRVFGRLWRDIFRQLAIDGVTLDLDSTVMTRYGEQAGAVRGYNPRKRGRPSHHPILAFVADTQMVANLWLRPGNANNACAFLADSLERLGGKRVELLRADAGFGHALFLAALDSQGVNHIVALPVHQPLQRALVEQRAWWGIDEPGSEGIELTRFEYQASGWSRPRTVVGIRQRLDLRPQARGKTLSLFADDPQWGQYRYGVLSTNLDLPALAIWRLYRGRANCENRIKELKYDFAAGSLCMQEFWATEAALNVVMLAFNLMSLFRQAMLKTTPPHTLATLRYKLFAQAGYITHEGRKRILKLATAMRKREWISGLWTQSKRFDLPVIFTPVFVHEQVP
ncbi:MAG: IS1380 family transposase [Pyrinomonadaceae bacterium]